MIVSILDDLQDRQVKHTVCKLHDIKPKDYVSGQNATFERYGNVSEDEEEERPSLPDDIYCGLIETLNEKCFVTSLLEMWRSVQHFVSGSTPQLSSRFRVVFFNQVQRGTH